MTAAAQYTPGPARTPHELNHVLGTAARSRAPHLGPADNEAVVNAAAAAAAAADTATATDPSDDAAELGEATEHTYERARTVFPESGTRPVSWSAFGAVIPVLAGSAGAGASSISAAISDVLQQAGRCGLFVDADDPARSGLACASSVEGPWVQRINPQIAIRYSWRQDALLARVETHLPTITPGMVPVPPDWLPDPAP
ncbi:MAG: hypothetical protein L0I76_37700, partial [Pseudonocardia sp.]|nr:hypothetical protein [Pseudonocardia sp.]